MAVSAVEAGAAVALGVRAVAVLLAPPEVVRAVL